MESDTIMSEVYQPRCPCEGCFSKPPIQIELAKVIPPSQVEAWNQKETRCLDFMLSSKRCDLARGVSGRELKFSDSDFLHSKEASSWRLVSVWFHMATVPKRFEGV